MFKFLNARYRHITGRHNIPYASLPVTRDLVAVDSIVIPCTGADFVEEALLSATFAERYATDVSEIVIVSDQPESAFGELPLKTRVVTLTLPKREEGYRYKQIYLSRLVKLNAPLQARGEGVLMIDSDLNLLKMPEINMADMHIYSSFRQGKMIAKLDGAPAEKVPAYYKETVRPYLVDHVNGAFLAATKKTSAPYLPAVADAVPRIPRELMDDTQPPTDQLPLAALLDMLDVKTVNWATG